MRGLHGDLGTMPLKDIVAYLGNRRATGTLTVECGVHRKQVVVQEGRVVNASSNEPREYLGQFLINLGYITEEQFNRAYQTQQETRIYLGKILVMIGAISEEAVQNALNLKFRETLLGAFGWTDGTFSFDPDAISMLPDGTDQQVDLVEVHREGEFRETAWEAIRGAFPSGDVRLRLEESRITEQPAPGTLDARLFALIRQGHSVDEIILALHATDFFLYQRLYALYRMGTLKVIEPSQVPAAVPAAYAPPEEAQVGEETSQEDILGAVEFQLAEGNFIAAETLARRAHELGPSRQTEEVMQRVEKGLAESLRRTLLEGRPVPTLRVAPSQLKTLRLSPPERYLLSRIDGQRDVPSIVHVSPLQELEALRLFHRFLEAGLITVDRF